MIRKILKMLWRTCVVFAGLGTLFVCCGVGYEIWQEKNYHYTTYEFKGAIKEHYFPNRNEYRLYNANTDRYPSGSSRW